MRFWLHSYSCCIKMELCFFFFKQKTAYEMRISDWSSDVCSSDLTESGAADDDQVQDLQHPRAAGSQGGFGLHQEESGGQTGQGEIGRASCRERVCQYV